MFFFRHFCYNFSLSQQSRRVAQRILDKSTAYLEGKLKRLYHRVSVYLEALEEAEDEDSKSMQVGSTL